MSARGVRLLGAGGLLAAWAWAAPAAAQSELRVDDFGALGNGVADDTAPIQAALDAAPAGAAVIFTPGKTYRIGNARTGIAPRSGSRLLLHGATLTMANEDGQRCRLVTLSGKSRVSVSGGTFIGSRLGAPEWGIGIHLSDSSDILIEDASFRDFFTDAVTVSGNAGSQRVHIRRCRAANMGRNGMSLIAGSDFSVEDSLFENTGNPDTNMPRAGLSAEPNAGNDLQGLLVARCHFRNNEGSGLLLQLGSGLRLSHLTVRDNVAENNGLGGLVLSAVSHAVVAGNRVAGHPSRNGYGIGVTRRSVSVVIKGNVLERNYRGIYAEGAQVVSIHGNTIVGTGAGTTPHQGDDGDGINLRGYTAIVDGQPQEVVSSQAVVTGNLIRQAAGKGILAAQVRQANISNNIVTESGQHGIHVQFGSADSQIQGNLVVGSGREQAGAYQDIFVSHASTGLLVAQNQHRQGAGVLAGIALDNAPDNIVSHNSFVAGPAVALLQSENAVRTAYNWRGSGSGWNRATVGGAIQFLPPLLPPAVAGPAATASRVATAGDTRVLGAPPSVLTARLLNALLLPYLAGERPFRFWAELTLEDLLRAAVYWAVHLDRLLAGDWSGPPAR